MRLLLAFVLAAVSGVAPCVAHDHFVPVGQNMLPPLAHTRFCIRYPAECTQTQSGGGYVDLTPERRKELVSVNARVNRFIRPEDQPHGEHGELEEWLLWPTTGDCNDYPVTKRHELMALGWNPEALLLAEVVVATNGEHHLVLVVRTNGGDLVLDNLNAQLRPWEQTLPGYRWVRIESPKNPMFWQRVAQ